MQTPRPPPHSRKAGEARGTGTASAKRQDQRPAEADSTRDRPQAPGTRLGSCSQAARDPGLIGRSYAFGCAPFGLAETGPPDHRLRLVIRLARTSRAETALASGLALRATFGRLDPRRPFGLAAGPQAPPSRQHPGPTASARHPSRASQASPWTDRQKAPRRQRPLRGTLPPLWGAPGTGFALCYRARAAQRPQDRREGSARAQSEWEASPCCDAATDLRKK